MQESKICFMEIRRIDINDFKDCEYVSYNDAGLLFARNLKGLPSEFVGAPLDFGLFVFCCAGSGVAHLSEGGECEFRDGMLLVYKYGDTITSFEASHDFDCVLIGYSWNLIMETPAIGAIIWALKEFIDRTPAIVVSTDTRLRIRRHIALMGETVALSRIFFRRELVLSIARSILYEYIMAIGDELARRSSFSDRKKKILREFFDVLEAGHGEIRSVNEVAERMNLSQRYLSKVVVELTGHRAVVFVNDYTMRGVASFLRDTDISVKNLAVKMHFSAPSALTRLVKQYTGLSPQGYRTALRNGEMIVCRRKA